MFWLVDGILAQQTVQNGSLGPLCYLQSCKVKVWLCETSSQCPSGQHNFVRIVAHSQDNFPGLKASRLLEETVQCPSIVRGKSCLLVETTEIELWQKLPSLVHNLITLYCSHTLKAFVVKHHLRNSSLSTSSLLGVVSPKFIYQANTQRDYIIIFMTMTQEGICSTKTE